MDTNVTLSELGLDAQEVPAFLTDLRLQFLLMLPAPAVLLYDTLLTFSQEVKCIWRRKWSAVTFLYAAIRYGTLLEVAYGCAIFYLVPKDEQSCGPLFYIDFVVVPIPYIAVAVFECLRVWSISHKNWILATVVFLLNMFSPCFDIYLNSGPQHVLFIPSGLLAGCWATDQVSTWPYLIVICRVAAIASDLIVLGVTLYWSAGIWKLSRGLSTTGLYSALMYNGIAQFLILSILNIGILILDVLGVTNLQTTLSQAINIVASLTAILICRFILDLRAIYPNDLSRDGVSHSNASSVRFASAVVGNVGAPLSGCNFLSSAAEVDSQEDSPIYTDEPLQTVLREDSDMETHLNEEDGNDIPSDEVLDIDNDGPAPSGSESAIQSTVVEGIVPYARYFV